MVYLRKDCILREEYHTILNRICQYCTEVTSLFLFFFQCTAIDQSAEITRCCCLPYVSVSAVRLDPTVEVSTVT